MKIQKTLAARGALVGWKRERSQHGILLTIQVADGVEHATGQHWQIVQLALNERQLRSFARDLARAAEERGLELFPRPRPRWRRLLRL
ncbi:hypothetical protein [Sphingomonas montana]|uniref:hypothetical protein n=1 Tax=Sphingomonas montana TaxID=1843236 RepID=UPI00096C33B3|nr:hypothetical protein [Sphingomonas montana]